MPRARRPRLQVLQSWIDSDLKLYVDIIIRENDLYCKVCERVINSSCKTNVTRHLKNHASSDSAIFFYELTEAFVASDIPLHKLKHPKLRQFLEKYMDRKIPHPNTLRGEYVDRVYKDVMKTIREDISDNFVYFIVAEASEATDACGHSVANFLIGALKSDSASDSHLLASKILNHMNHETIVNFVEECFQNLWPDQDNSDKVLVMLSDAATYMLKAGKILSEKFPNMLHFTCAAHALNGIAEKIRDSFPLVNELIANVKKIFLKAPTRRDAFRNMLLNTPLPPEPVVTRWGTWLQAVAYYDEHYDTLKKFICGFDDNESSAIRKVQNLLEVQGLRDDIHYINTNYSILIRAIQKLETWGLSVQEQFTIVDDVKQQINKQNTHIVKTLREQKLEDVFNRNPGFSMVENICKVLNGMHQKLPPNILKYTSCMDKFSYCPLSFVDLERSFSVRKLLPSDRRRSFTPENLEKYLVIKFHHRRRDT